MSPLAQSLRSSVQYGTKIDWQIAQAAQWSLALNEHLGLGSVTLLQQCAEIVKKQFPNDRHAIFISNLAAQAILQKPTIPFEPRGNRDFLPFVKAGTKTVVFVFCGVAHGVGFPLSLAHRWFGALNASVIYLFDENSHFYFDGLASISGGFNQTADYLLEFIQQHGFNKVCCYGNSQGTYAAIKMAAALNASSVLAFAGPTNLEPDFLIEHNIYLKRLPLLLNNSENAVDLRALLLKHPNPPNITLYFGFGNLPDRIQAENLSGLSFVTLKSLDCAAHNVVREIILKRFFGETLLNLVQA